MHLVLGVYRYIVCRDFVLQAFFSGDMLRLRRSQARVDIVKLFRVLQMDPSRYSCLFLGNSSSIDIGTLLMFLEYFMARLKFWCLILSGQTSNISSRSCGANRGRIFPLLLVSLICCSATISLRGWSFLRI